MWLPCYIVTNCHIITDIININIIIINIKVLCVSLSIAETAEPAEDK